MPTILFVFAAMVFLVFGTAYVVTGIIIVEAADIDPGAAPVTATIIAVGWPIIALAALVYTFFRPFFRHNR